jgi:hypothetical protein
MKTSSRICSTIAIASITLLGQASSAELDLRAALLKEDLDAIKAAVKQGVDQLGERAGVPEVPDEFKPVPATARILSAEEASQAMSKSMARLDQIKFWQIGLDPTRLTAPLRAPASVVAGMVAAHRGQLAQGNDALENAKEAADFLVWAQEQAGAGCYPFPAARNTSQDRAMQVGTRFLEHAENAGILGQTVRNGWAYEDHGDGGLQFDNAECGVALLELYEATLDQRYLDSAVKAADWAMARPLCTNWNYNSFSVNLLSKAHQVTGESKYLAAALKKALLGVIPGQLTDGPHAGRWADPHNARPAYHYIMLAALARLASELPEDHADRSTVLSSLKLGLISRNREFLTKGVMNKDKSMECLTLVHRLFSDDAALLAETKSTEALNLLERFVSEEARSGRIPLGPRGWCEMLARCAASADKSP